MYRCLTLFFLFLSPFTVLNADDAGKALLIKLYTSKTENAEGILDQLSRQKHPKKIYIKSFRKGLIKQKGIFQSRPRKLILPLNISNLKKLLIPI